MTDSRESAERYDLNPNGRVVPDDELPWPVVPIPGHQNNQTPWPTYGPDDTFEP